MSMKLPFLRCFSYFFLLFVLSTPVWAHAAGDSKNAAFFASIVCLLFVVHLFSLAASKIKLPSVSVEMFVGILLGNSALWGQPDVAVWVSSFSKDSIVLFLSDIGLLLLLFEIGLHLDPERLKKSGVDAVVVAFLGAFFALLLGVLVIGPLFLVGTGLKTWLFVGATLSATSIAVTSRLFADFGVSHVIESQITLGAAVFDDIFGFALLAALSELVQQGTISYSLIFVSLAKAFAFLFVFFFVGRPVIGFLVRFLAKYVDDSSTMLLIILVGFACFGAYSAHLCSLAPIVGAFAAGLALGEDHFSLFQDEGVSDIFNQFFSSLKTTAMAHVFSPPLKEKFALIKKKQYVHLLFPFKKLFLPIFFIIVGTELNLRILFDWKNIFLFLVILVFSIISKLLSGVFLKSANRWIVGWGMVPRGEVGLIFLAAGRSYGVIVDPYFSILVAVVVMTTVVSPWILAGLLKRYRDQLSY